MSRGFATAVIVTAIAALSACATTPPPEPAPAAVPQALPGGYVERLSADGLFAFGKSSIDDFNLEGRTALDALAAKITDGRPLDVIHVIGHSDRIGSADANLRLSTRRADAVRDYLIERGVPADKITAVGRGSVEPVVACEGETGNALIDCLAPNRRVEIRVQFAN